MANQNETFIEYKVRPITRYVVTRYHEDVDGKSSGSGTKGTYDNYQTAFDVAYALAEQDREKNGWKLDDDRIQFPK